MYFRLQTIRVHARTQELAHARCSVVEADEFVEQALLIALHPERANKNPRGFAIGEGGQW